MSAFASTLLPGSGTRPLLALLLWATCLTVATAAAPPPSASAPLHPSALYAQECAACHIAYPARMLPAPSWRWLTSSLDRHFGTDASLDPATVAALAGWLEAGAARSGRSVAPPAEDRITRSDWFVREHRAFDAAAWAIPSVRSAANCAACHRGAADGDFKERGLRIPAGMPARYWRAFED